MPLGESPSEGIRRYSNQLIMIWWITGNTGSGKTTLSKRMKDVVVLDGNELRTCWDLGFSKEDRWEQNLRAAKLAKSLENQGFDVVVATICPYKELRKEVQQITGCMFIYLSGGKNPSKEFPYERV